jgi:hypothetical protein
MAGRREAQVLLDSASSLLGKADAAQVAALLDTAAAFFRVQAKSPPSAGTTELLATADSLQAVSVRLGRGRAVNSSELRALSARANLAEAERHGALASVAWSTQSRESVADELLMAADHVERAAVDGGIAMPREMRGLLSEMRELAAQVPRTPGVDLQARGEPLVELHLRIAVMRGRLEDVTAGRP